MKKIILPVLLALALNTNVAHADMAAYKAKVALYLESGYDFMGFRGEKLYFSLRDYYAGNDKLKTIEFDLFMFKEQFEISHKAVDDNRGIYAFIGLLAGKFFPAKYIPVPK